ncbi:MAG: Hsp20 family protein [Lachnospiraceae bacterium]
MKERDNMFVLEVELSGFQKDEVRAFVKEGYLIVSAISSGFVDKEAFRRAFFVGNNISLEGIRCAFLQEQLKIMIPKKEALDGMSELELVIL